MSDVTVGSEATYDDLNYRLLAGRYPEAVNEIAVSEEIYEMFAWGGYVDAIAEGCYTLQEFTLVFEKYEAYAWDDSVIPPEEAGEDRFLRRSFGQDACELRITGGKPQRTA